MREGNTTHHRQYAENAVQFNGRRNFCRDVVLNSSINANEFLQFEELCECLDLCKSQEASSMQGYIVGCFVPWLSSLEDQRPPESKTLPRFHHFISSFHRFNLIVKIKPPSSPESTQVFAPGLIESYLYTNTSLKVV